MKTPSAPRPIAPTDRVSDVLARDDTLVEVFARHSPHFAKLRIPAMRRVMARLVTVEQAARMAHVSAAGLAAELNAALGIGSTPAGRNPAAPPTPLDGSDSGARAASAEPPERRHPGGRRVVVVDVREDLRAGREPFATIMRAVRALGPEEVLRVRAIFEPVPLYAVLAKHGLVHEAGADDAGDWSVWFWRPAKNNARPGGAEAEPAPAAAVGEPPPRAPTTPGPQELPGDMVWLDVRNLEPPQPMLHTLTALETLPAGHTLVQVNARVPHFLLPILVERGFDFEVDETRQDRVLVRIRRAT
ncbi:MAG TPA: DUF2249 domain-containing protein [Gemmatimonadales bacterium]|nr:DUF2249 domain-containing protein [Gemmatimonadales bacterium]